MNERLKLKLVVDSEYKGFKYKLMQASEGQEWWYNAYIHIPDSHPLFGHSYTTQLEFLNHESMDTYFNAAGSGINYANYTSEGFMIGFDSISPHEINQHDYDLMLAYVFDTIDQIIDSENIYRLGSKVYNTLKTIIHETVAQAIKEINNDKD